MHSPRFAAISTPKQQDQYKLLLNRSTRRADDDNLREYYLLTGNKNGRTESMDAVELNWEHQWHNKHRSSVSLFFNDYDLVGWDGSAQQINRIGNLKTLGLELEGHLKFERQSLSILYSYVAEEDFTLAEAGVRQFISASVYGYGSDLANWAKHTLKFIYQTQMNEHWDYFSSLRMLMDLSGSEAMADYNLIENNNSVSSLPRTDGKGNAYEDRYFLDVGLRYKMDGIQAGLHAYNILGWLDKDSNRHNAFGRSDQYRLEPPALAFSLEWKL